jgi:hypothetical protein
MNDFDISTLVFEDLPSRLSADTETRIEKGKRKTEKQRQSFVMIPYRVGMEIASKTNNVPMAVLFELIHRVFLGYGTNPVALPNTTFRELGITGRGKLYALESLERSGFITVVHRGKQSPLVTLNWLPTKES